MHTQIQTDQCSQTKNTHWCLNKKQNKTNQPLPVCSFMQSITALQEHRNSSSQPPSWEKEMLVLVHRWGGPCGPPANRSTGRQGNRNKYIVLLLIKQRLIILIVMARWEYLLGTQSPVSFEGFRSQPYNRHLILSHSLITLL